ncbi:conserved hypothetical protein [Trichinella spiralis]|uniref:hypothetical protein n=1 Tax=Trichinella spiralis TaxID=6334 RepID=UPI0001EFECF5|nr:conserved hypothetical protein [Trichinella spiralis]
MGTQSGGLENRRVLVMAGLQADNTPCVNETRAVVSVIPESLWHSASGGEPLKREKGTIKGYVRIEHASAPAGQPGISAAVVANSQDAKPDSDRRGLAIVTASPPPSPSPAGGDGSANQGNATHRGNRTSLSPLEFTSCDGEEEGRIPAVLRGLPRTECCNVSRRPTRPVHRRYAGCAGICQMVQHARLGVRLLAGRSRGKRPGENSLLNADGSLSIQGHAIRRMSWQHVKEIQQFLCLAYCYRRFVKNFSGFAGRLHALIRKGHRWSWWLAQTQECPLHSVSYGAPTLRPAVPAGR